MRKALHVADQDRIPAGATIVIPRKAKEYDEAIKSLQQLLAEVDKDTAKSLKELDGYKAEADRIGAAVDIADSVTLRNVKKAG